MRVSNDGKRSSSLWQHTLLLVTLELRNSITTQIEHTKIKTRASADLHNCRIREDFNLQTEMCLYSEFFSGPFFPVFELNTERYFVSFHIQFECKKIRTRYAQIFRSDSYSLKSSLDTESMTKTLYSPSKQGSNNCTYSAKFTTDHFKDTSIHTKLQYHGSVKC